MRKKLSLVVITCLTVCLTFLHDYIGQGHLFKDSFPLNLTISIGLIFAASLLGLICWIAFSRRKSVTVNYLIAGNCAGLAFILSLNLIVLYKHWHYEHYQSNIDYNESLTKQGGYLDTCMIFAQKAIRRHVSNPNDFKILSYSYDLELTTIPRDTTNRFYELVVIYSKKDGSDKTVRVAKYLINFRQDFKIVFDADIREKRAKPVVDDYRKDFLKLKTNLDKFKDSNNESPLDLKEKLKSFK
jgi:hypothetical protein